jgi:TolA-binding protein
MRPAGEEESAMRLFRIALLGVALTGPLGVATGALAQMESREAIALQNEILRLRQEMEALRRGGLPPPSGYVAPPSPRAPAGPQSELVPQLLDRVARLEEELRSVRGRAEQAEFRERDLRERVEKLQGDIDFRLRQIEEQRGGGGAAPPRPAAPPPAAAQAPPAASPAAPPVPPPQAPPTPLARPPQRALADGQAALGRRDYISAEAAAREVLAARDPARMTDAQILLGDALIGKRDFAGAAIAYDDAYRRNQQGSRAAEAMLGVANALIGLNNNRDACGQLNDLRSRYPNHTGAMAERVGEARRRAQCR